MKTLTKKSTIVCLAIILLLKVSNAQNKQSIAVINVDTRNINLDANSMTDLVRLELEKTHVYTVMDKFDVNDYLKKSNLKSDSCFSKTCLINIGKALQVDKILTGNIDLIGEKVVIVLKMFDIKTESAEKTDVMEYINLPEIQKMVEISVKNIAGLKNDEKLLDLIVSYDAPIISPKTQLRLNGPRMGASYIMAPASKALQAPKSEGGFDMFPITSDFGYQYETKYLSSGNFQALIEYVFTISGIESGKFFPSFAFLNGLRENTTGFEFAFGPIFKFTKIAEGFYDSYGFLGEKNKWHVLYEWPYEKGNIRDYYTIKERVDNRGRIKFASNLAFAIGKTFRSGYLNIPVNLYFIPDKEGSVIGLSFGFNVSKIRK
ncbi:MAG: hypothetical protein PHD97_06010 [Bacteroidales bacterium]|nr:hypothetical protein [Bacteroidales bacterium]